MDSYWREGGCIGEGKGNKKKTFVSSSVTKSCIRFLFDFNVLFLRTMLLEKREKKQMPLQEQTVGHLSLSLR